MNVSKKKETKPKDNKVEKKETPPQTPDKTKKSN